jgi:hypothetical protein
MSSRGPAALEDEEEAVQVLTERDIRLKKLKARDEDDQSGQMVLFGESSGFFHHRATEITEKGEGS